jgi:NADH dehydrogenase
VITGDGKEFFYDFLIVATGARHDYFGHDQWEENAPGLKTLGDALSLRENILTAFEKAEVSDCEEERATNLRFVVIGGGPTGVEMAGAIAEIATEGMKGNFRAIAPEKAEVILIEGLGQVLPSFPPKLSLAAKAGLEEMGVKVLVDSRVTNVTKEGVSVGEHFIPTHTVIWAAGNQASPLLRALDTNLDRQGRAIVEPDLSLPGFEEVFVIGDAACTKGKGGSILPGVAPVAIQQGCYVGKLIKTGKRAPFKYQDKGTMATIGHAKAVAMVWGLQFSGFFAWIAWGLIHIMYIIGFHNRSFVMLHWFYLYIIGKRKVRLITRRK